jgi:hypothetical protein
MEKIQFGEALTADFEENTFTFEMDDPSFTASAGAYAIVRIDTLDEKMKLEEFINSL